MIELDHAEVQVLGERGFFLQDGFLGPDAAGAACTAARALADAGGLRTAGVSRGTGYRRDPATRGDEAAWLLPADAPAGLHPLCERFEALRSWLNREAFLGLARFGLQLARYRPAQLTPATSTRSRADRTGGWSPEHGGLLRLHLPDGPLDVEPVLDRLVVFLADRIEHEVLLAAAPRWAVTAWYCGREDIPRA